MSSFCERRDSDSVAFDESPGVTPSLTIGDEMGVASDIVKEGAALGIGDTGPVGSEIKGLSPLITIGGGLAELAMARRSQGAHRKQIAYSTK